MIRASQSAILLLSILVMVASACGEPGLPSSNIALERTSDGRVLMLYRICPGIQPERISVGNSLDRWSEPSVELLVHEKVGSLLEVELSSPAEQQLEIDKVNRPLEMEAPIFVRIDTDSIGDGIVFTAMPPPGFLRYEPFDSRQQRDVRPAVFRLTPADNCD
ncbi:MAG: hypothetical protein V9F03_10495 [Microthrixaceae bacterium]